MLKGLEEKMTTSKALQAQLAALTAKVIEMQSLAEVGCAENAWLAAKRSYLWARATKLEEEIATLKA